LYFSSGEETHQRDKYRLVLEGARFADRHGFAAVWVPERHFTQVGCLFPNPSVVQAALARETARVRLRAGSVVLPIHHPVRVAEEWAVVDNLSDGRVELSFASGWHPDDFLVLATHYRVVKLVQGWVAAGAADDHCIDFHVFERNDLPTGHVLKLLRRPGQGLLWKVISSTRTRTTGE
jgi:hypothetical protein